MPCHDHPSRDDITTCPNPRKIYNVRARREERYFQSARRGTLEIPRRTSGTPPSFMSCAPGIAIITATCASWPSSAKTPLAAESGGGAGSGGVRRRGKSLLRRLRRPDTTGGGGGSGSSASGGGSGAMIFAETGCTDPNKKGKCFVSTVA